MAVAARKIRSWGRVSTATHRRPGRRDGPREGDGLYGTSSGDEAARHVDGLAQRGGVGVAAFAELDDTEREEKIIVEREADLRRGGNDRIPWRQFRLLEWRRGGVACCRPGWRTTLAVP